MRLTPGWVDVVLGRLDDRLAAHHPAPVALALSGGGDSLALLHIAVDWARRRGRRILALTVDHGLSAASAEWTAFAGQAARALGADWRSLPWTGRKPTTGLPAAARAARHALLAEAARDGGARVILMAHTAGDVAEGDWMRTEGTPLGRLRDWAPSPAWPEGRGLMLLRPLLDVTRADLRALLAARDAAWIEDPANADPRFHRARARGALGADGAAPSGAPDRGPLDLVCDPVSGAVSGPLDSVWLGHAAACASGRAGLPSSRAVEAARARLMAGARVVTLSGALLSRDGGRIVATRERGRRPTPDLPLAAGRPGVWDGRFEYLASAPGWSVGAASGRMSGLSAAERAALAALPPAARPAHPVLFREGDARPVLANPSIEARCLVPDRLRLASGGVRREDDLDTPPWRGLHHRPI